MTVSVRRLPLPALSQAPSGESESAVGQQGQEPEV